MLLRFERYVMRQQSDTYPGLLRQILRQIGYPVVVTQVASIPLLPGGTTISGAIDVRPDRVG